MKNIAFIGVSIDGRITDRNNDLDWLQMVPNPDNNDFGWSEFISGIDALVMGRKTYETVLGFGIEWPYTIPVFVVSTSNITIPDELSGKVEQLKFDIEEIVEVLNKRGYQNLYIDGASLIKSFLNQDILDEIITTTIPIILGGGVRLFTELDTEFNFEHVSTKVYLEQMVQTHYKRKR